MLSLGSGGKKHLHDAWQYPTNSLWWLLVLKITLSDSCAFASSPQARITPSPRWPARFVPFHRVPLSPLTVGAFARASPARPAPSFYYTHTFEAFIDLFSAPIVCANLHTNNTPPFDFSCENSSLRSIVRPNHVKIDSPPPHIAVVRVNPSEPVSVSTNDGLKLLLYMQPID